MKVNFKNNYDLIGSTIDNNILTIRSLIIKANNLSEIAKTMKEDSIESKSKLVKIIGSINSDIRSLMKQTAQLFDLYKEGVKKF
jgi:hypothetical protein